MGVVMTVHSVRLLTIVFVFLPIVLAVVGS